MATEPLVSVLCITFDHADYIRQALDGFVAQRTDFPFEVIVHDDASTDGTAAIIREYEQRFPELIKGIYQTENQYSRERGRVTRIVHAAARGKYIATCEGDDYWIDPLKLQDQAALMEAHPTMPACFTDAWSETDGERTEFHPMLASGVRPAGGTDLDGILLENFVPTATLMFRRAFLFPAPEQMFIAPAGDWMLLVHLAKAGGLGYLDRKTAVRRRHPGGVISMKGLVSKLAMTVGCLQHIRTMVNATYHARIDDRIALLRRMALEDPLRQGDLATARNVWSTFKGAGFPYRERVRYLLLLNFPKFMRVYHRMRGGDVQ